MPTVVPATPVLDESEEAIHEEETPVVIDLDDFEADRRDPGWQAFLREALEHRRRLRQAGRVR